MSITVCIAPATLDYPLGGGYLWAYLNWALGLRALGCNVLWLEGIAPGAPTDHILANIRALKNRLEHYGFVNCLAVHSWNDDKLPREIGDCCVDLDSVTESELLLELRYNTPLQVVKRFRRSALVDLDPGLLQTWINKGQVYVAPHDVYFTIGEMIGQPGTLVPDVGLTWIYTPPCVALDWWPSHDATGEAAFTTIAHWYASASLLNEQGDWDEKRTGFLPFLDIPRLTSHPFELALDLWPEDEQRSILQHRGWRVVDAHQIASTPWDYQSYIQDSLGEFSCAKPSYVRLETAWVSDRTLCYLASGKPAVVQYTGRSRFLPDSAGLFRFCELKDAANCVERVLTDYEHQCQLARKFAEEYFDARKVVANVLERAL